MTVLATGGLDSWGIFRLDDHPGGSTCSVGC